jgi:hypothetical protein
VTIEGRVGIVKGNGDLLAREDIPATVIGAGETTIINLTICCINEEDLGTGLPPVGRGLQCPGWLRQGRVHG